MGGLDGPGLARLAGLTPRDIATAMQLRQQAYRDQIRSLYEQAITERIREETKMLEPKYMLDWARLINQAKSSLAKDVDYLRSQGKPEEFVNDYIRSKMGYLGEYEKYISQQKALGKKPSEIETFDQFQERMRKSGATKISIGEKVETTRRTTKARQEVMTESYLWGPKAADDAMKQASKQYSNEIFLSDNPELESKKWANVILETKLRAYYGKDNVEAAMKPDGSLGWWITDKSGKRRWKDAL